MLSSGSENTEGGSPASAVKELEGVKGENTEEITLSEAGQPSTIEIESSNSTSGFHAQETVDTDIGKTEPVAKVESPEGAEGVEQETNKGEKSGNEEEMKVEDTSEATAAETETSEATSIGKIRTFDDDTPVAHPIKLEDSATLTNDRETPSDIEKENSTGRDDKSSAVAEVIDGPGFAEKRESAAEQESHSPLDSVEKENGVTPQSAENSGDAEKAEASTAANDVGGDVSGGQEMEPDQPAQTGAKALTQTSSESPQKAHADNGTASKSPTPANGGSGGASGENAIETDQPVQAEEKPSDKESSESPEMTERENRTASHPPTAANDDSGGVAEGNVMEEERPIKAEEKAPEESLGNGKSADDERNSSPRRSRRISTRKPPESESASSGKAAKQDEIVPDTAKSGGRTGSPVTRSERLKERRRRAIPDRVSSEAKVKTTTRSGRIVSPSLKVLQNAAAEKAASSSDMGSSQRNERSRRQSDRKSGKKDSARGKKSSSAKSKVDTDAASESTEGNNAESCELNNESDVDWFEAPSLGGGSLRSRKRHIDNLCPPEAAVKTGKSKPRRKSSRTASKSKMSGRRRRDDKGDDEEDSSDEEREDMNEEAGLILANLKQGTRPNGSGSDEDAVKSLLLLANNGEEEDDQSEEDRGSEKRRKRHKMKSKRRSRSKTRATKVENTAAEDEDTVLSSPRRKKAGGVRLMPTAGEIKDCRTSRARAALQSWYNNLAQLVDFKEKHGHCNVPQKTGPLGIWVNKQRMHYKALEDGKPTSLTQEKLAQLNKIGFNWGNPKGQPCWDYRFKELLEFYEEFGHSNVPTKYTKKPALGRWVSTQRSEYKKFQRKTEHTQMTEVHIEKLEKLGFQWAMQDYPAIRQTSKNGDEAEGDVDDSSEQGKGKRKRDADGKPKRRPSKRQKKQNAEKEAGAASKEPEAMVVTSQSEGTNEMVNPGSDGSDPSVPFLKLEGMSVSDVQIQSSVGAVGAVAAV